MYSKEYIDQKGKEQSIGGQSISAEVAMPSTRVDNARETERHVPGSSVTRFIPETNLLKEAEKLGRVVEPEHGEGMRNNLMPRKLDAETQALETKESLMSASKVAHPDAINNAVPTGMEGNRSIHGQLPGFPLRESWKSHSGMEGERQMVVPKSSNALEKDAVLGNNHEEENNSERSPSPPPTKYTTSEKWITDFQKRSNC